MEEINNLYNLFRRFPKITTDTRNDVRNSIFFALCGEKYNGNEFAKTAINKGAILAVVDDEKYFRKNNYLLVSNSLKTLQQLAVHHRNQYSNPLLAITGTNGKTTTKELISTVLKTSYTITSTSANYNNHIGVPLTLLQINSDTEFVVLEMGANHIGEIASLCTMAKPDLGIITNIGKAHLEGFGSYEGVISAKNELYEYLRQTNGNLFVNNSDPLLIKLSDGIARKLYGADAGEISGEIISFKPYLKIQWQTMGKKYLIDSALYGTYNFDNIMAAIAVGRYCNIDPEKISQAISDYIPQNNRSQHLVTPKNRVLLDAYNANPVSMAGAIRSFLAYQPVNAWLILGDMFELGEASQLEHEKIVELLAGSGFKNVILVGNNFHNLTDTRGYLTFSNTQETYEYLKKNPIKKAEILIKGSRGMQLEKLVSLL